MDAHGEKTPAFDDDVWELYDTNKDWSQANDLSKQMPEKLHELQRLWLIEATRYNVLPLDDRLMERINPDTAGRPVLIKGKTPTPLRRHGPSDRELRPEHQEQVSLGHRRDRGAGTGAQGVIVAQGANIGGWSLYAKDGKLKYCYNLGGVKYFYVEGATPIPAGEHQVRMEFAYAGGGLGKGGNVTLYTDGKKVGEGVIPATLAMIYSADDGCDVGFDGGAPFPKTTARARQRIQRPGQRGAARHRRRCRELDHLVKPEDAIRIAMARQ